MVSTDTGGNVEAPVVAGATADPGVASSSGEAHCSRCASHGWRRGETPTSPAVTTPTAYRAGTRNDVSEAQHTGEHTGSGWSL